MVFYFGLILDSLKEAMKLYLIFAENIGYVETMRTEMGSWDSPVSTMGRTTGESVCDSKLG